MNENPLEPAAIAEHASHLETLVNLLNNPALAHVYVYICYWGPAPPPDITDALDLSKATTYNYVDTPVERSLVDRDESARPQQLTAPPVGIVDPAHSVYVTPTVLHAIALEEIDEDVAYFVERHGVGKLIAALRGTGLHFAGNATQRMVANDIDVQHLEGMMIVYALIPALAMGQQYDPYFESLFPDVHEEKVIGCPTRRHLHPIKISSSMRTCFSRSVPIECEIPSISLRSHSCKRRPEHEIEKTDTILAGLTIQYLRDTENRSVVVISDDVPAKRGIETAVQAQGYEDSVTVLSRFDIIGDDPGSVRVL